MNTTKNLLCILVESYYRISGKATPVPRHMMEIFDLFNQPLINHMMRQGKSEKQVLPHSYKLVTNKSDLIVSYTNTRPVQFDLCTLPSADTFIDKEGSGWNKTNIAEYFSVTIADQRNGGTQRHNQRHQNMTSSLQYEAHHIMLWTI